MAIVTSRTEAELIAVMLRNHDLRAVVSTDDARGQDPALQIQGVRVLVAPFDEAAARQLLAAAWDTSPEASHGTFSSADEQASAIGASLLMAQPGHRPGLPQARRARLGRDCGGSGID